MQTILTTRRNTKQRGMILSIIKASHSHPTADDIYMEAKSSMPGLSLGTVYRNLRLLAEEGAIKEVHSAGSASRFDGMTSEHEHFICNSCGKIRDIAPTIGDKAAKFAEPALHGGVVTGYSLNYYGLCSECR